MRFLENYRFAAAEGEKPPTSVNCVVLWNNPSVHCVNYAAMVL